MTDDEEFYLKALAGLNPALTPVGLFGAVTTEALDAFGSGDLMELVDGYVPQAPAAVPPSRLTSAQRNAALQFIAAENALDLLERLTRALPQHTSLRLGLLFLRIGVADFANRRVTMTDLIEEDLRGFAPTPGWPDGKRSPTYVGKTMRNAYLRLEPLVETVQGVDADGRNQYLRLSPDGRAVFRNILRALPDAPPA